MNKTLITTLKMWGEFREHERQADMQYIKQGATIPHLHRDEQKSYGKFMDFWFKKAKENGELND